MQFDLEMFKTQVQCRPLPFHSPFTALSLTFH